MKKITSIINVFGNSTEVNKMRNLVNTSTKCFEFNNVIPEPKQLEATLEDDFLTEKEEIHRLSTYGATNPLEWRKMYWGTISPTISVSWFNNSYCKLTTEESAPIGIFRSLSLRFNVVLCVLVTGKEESSILIVNKGTCSVLKATDNESTIVFNTLIDHDYTYEKWETANKKTVRGKKLDMELLFHCETSFLAAARKIIDPKNNEVADSAEKVI